MLFKNILLYRFTEQFQLSAEELENSLLSQIFQPCPKSEAFSYGWVSPLGEDHSQLVHSCNGYLFFTACKEEKILPGSVINEELRKKVAIIEKSEDRKIRRKEKLDLKEEIIFDLRRQAFERKRMLYAYIDPRNQWLVIDTQNRNRAEEFCAFLRKSLGSLKISLPETKANPSLNMTNWLLNNVNLEGFHVDNDCDMMDVKQRTAVVKCRQQDLSSDEIVNHLKSGKIITNLGMRWRERISFDLSEDLCFKRVKFQGLMQERDDFKDLSKEALMDANFALMTGEFAEMIHEVVNLFEGFQETQDA